LIKIRGIGSAGGDLHLEVEYDCLGEVCVSTIVHPLEQVKDLSRGELKAKVVEYVNRQRRARMRELVEERIRDLVEVDLEAEEENTVA